MSKTLHEINRRPLRGLDQRFEMNNPVSFVLGWGSFTVAVLGGAYIGYGKAQETNQQRRIGKFACLVQRG